MSDRTQPTLPPSHLIVHYGDFAFGSIAVRIKRCVRRPSGKVVTKFKIRCTKYLYTLVLDDLDKAHKLQQSLPPSAYPLSFLLLLDSFLHGSNRTCRDGLDHEEKLDQSLDIIRHTSLSPLDFLMWSTCLLRNCFASTHVYSTCHMQIKYDD